MYKFKVNRVMSAGAVVFLAFGFTGCNEVLNLLPEQNQENAQVSTEFDQELIRLIEANNMDVPVTRNLNLPDINDPLPQLGKKLFYAKSLGGDLTVACASCHHPSLGGADALSVSIGANAVVADNLGLSRRAENDDFNVGRNAPTVFNTGLWRDGLFWDSRVEFVDNNLISSPDSGFGVADANAGVTLAAAQARFPVTSEEEMLGTTFANGDSTEDIRDHLAERLGDYGSGTGLLATNEWLIEFQQGFGSNAQAETLITFDNIAHAIGEFERSMVFVDSPWQQFIAGDSSSMTDSQKRGAILFLTPPNNNNDGAGCVACHRSPTFTDESFNLVAFPQLGPITNIPGGDIGRAFVTGNNNDQYRFRTPSLLNVELTAPYGHAGAYQTLEEVVAHYDNPNRSVTDFFDENKICDLPQFRTVSNCATLYSDAENISEAALDDLNPRNRTAGNGIPFPNINLNQQEMADIVEFLKALTDNCAGDLSCLQPWIADSVLDNPDGTVLL